MYHAINSNLQSFVCQLKKTLLNIVWGLPSGTENALRKEISIAALPGWQELRDQRLWMAAACSVGASGPATISVPEDAAQGVRRETLQGDFKGTKLFCFVFLFFFPDKTICMEFSSNDYSLEEPSFHHLSSPVLASAETLECWLATKNV